MRLLLIATVLLLTAPAHADFLRVVDGDTIYLPDRRVRLWGIDAPELSAPCGRAAKVWLQRHLLGKKLRCLKKYTDRYGRSVELCKVGGEDVALSLVAAGWARDWPRYSDGYYGAAEVRARGQGVGIWGDGLCSQKN